MSESYPPTGDQVPEVPPAPEAPREVPAVPPSPSATPSGTTPPQSAAPSKPKITWAFFALGFVAPAAAAVVQGLVASGVAQLQALAPLGALAGVLQLAVIVLATWAFVTGRSTGDDRRRSFGLGAYAAFAVSALVLLLAFGACLVSLGTGGNFLGS